VELADKTCLIIGASGSIGRAIADIFYREGARVALTFHSKRKSAPSKGLPSKGPRVALFRLDVRKRRDVRVVVGQVTKKFGPIHVLVNCSGVLGPIGTTHNASVKHWVETIEINLVGSFYVVRAVLPSMLAAGEGKIIQFSGGGAAYGRPFFTAYSASKAALVRFTESLAAELRDSNIQINAIAPGPVKSRMWNELRASNRRAKENGHDRWRSCRACRCVGLIPSVEPLKRLDRSPDKCGARQMGRNRIVHSESDVLGRMDSSPRPIGLTPCSP
jgi:NAD(P)-dependent dehydrogenase (short-subunit alcohol dehydrogenase family)